MNLKTFLEKESLNEGIKFFKQSAKIEKIIKIIRKQAIKKNYLNLSQPLLRKLEEIKIKFAIIEDKFDAAKEKEEKQELKKEYSELSVKYNELLNVMKDPGVVKAIKVLGIGSLVAGIFYVMGNYIFNVIGIGENAVLASGSDDAGMDYNPQSIEDLKKGKQRWDFLNRMSQNAEKVFDTTGEVKTYRDNLNTEAKAINAAATLTAGMPVVLGIGGLIKLLSDSYKKSNLYKKTSNLLKQFENEW